MFGRRTATLAATGLLALVALGGTTAAASAVTAPLTVHVAAGPFANARDCEAAVIVAHEWGVWDCEYVQGHWYAFAP
ncbi:hypothetical protein [Streptomyces sp. YS-3]|uniref:hypothetical protein n=1 Tax=Streptomyces sp. YS-3 TaxID=3381352 RepID=UPI003862CCDA